MNGGSTSYVMFQWHCLAIKRMSNVFVGSNGTSFDYLE